MMADDQLNEDQRGLFEREEFERLTRGTTFRDLRQLPEHELARRYDALLASPQLHMMLGPEDYLNELHRRETERQSKRLEWLTWALFLLTATLVALELLPRISGAGH